MSLSPEELTKAANILKTIAHPIRLGIVQLLGKHPRLSVSDICAYLDCEQSLVSHHLNIMRLKAVLDAEREGKRIFYSLIMREVLGVVECVEKCAPKF